jgi:hypothetical protein
MTAAGGPYQHVIYSGVRENTLGYRTLDVWMSSWFSSKTLGAADNFVAEIFPVERHQRSEPIQGFHTPGSLIKSSPRNSCTKATLPRQALGAGH